MKYVQGKIGRVFLVRFEHGEDLLKGLAELVKRENIRAGVVHFLGALERAEIVVGPERLEVPPTPMWKSFQDGREVLGLGTIFWRDDEPKIHIHSGIGRDNAINLGCIRKDAKIYLVVEAVIIELEGMAVKRRLDEKTKLDILEFD